MVLTIYHLMRSSALPAVTGAVTEAVTAAEISTGRTPLAVIDGPLSRRSTCLRESRSWPCQRIRKSNSYKVLEVIPSRLILNI